MKTWKELHLDEGYLGEDWFKDWFVLYGRNRDSRILEQSNFESILKYMGGESDNVQIIRSGHWACGWIEFLLVNPIDTDKIELAENVGIELAKYPVFDDSDYYSHESEYAIELWRDIPIKERITLCIKAGVSIFAARREYIPEEDNGTIYEHLTCDA